MQKKKRNKAYKPKPIDRAGGLAVINNAYVKGQDRMPLHDDQLTDLGIAYRLAFSAMTSGQGTEDHWCTVVNSLNVALVLAERGLGKEYEPKVIEALDGAFVAQLRAHKTGKWGFDGGTIQAIKLAFELHEEQVKLASREEVRQALLEVGRRIQTGEVYREAA